MQKFIKKFFAALLALTMVLSMVPVSVFAAEDTVAFDGSTIYNLDQLKDFRDSVNNGTTYDNQTVTLAADIDLGSEAWTPIGNGTAKFLGTFDGGNYTISNLVVDVDTNHAGLFGFASVIKNLKLHNATVSGVVCVGTVVGELESSVGTVDNCHVTGAISVTGENSVGGLAGKGYANIKNSSVTGADGSFVLGAAGTTEEGDNVGGIIGHLGEGNTLGVAYSSVENLTVKGTRKVGGIVGTTARGNDIVGCSVTNVTVECTATAEYAADNASTTTIGGIVGNYFGTATSGGILSDCTVTDLTLVQGNAVSAGALVGGDRANGGGEPDGVETTGNTASGVTGASTSYYTAAVAQIGDKTYSSLQEALNVGGTVTLLDNVTLEDTLKIPAGVTVTLDLNGKTICQAKACTAHYNMIANYGTLTVTGEGLISFCDTGAGDANFGWGSYTLANYGTLVVENGTIEDLSTQNSEGTVVHMHCAIQQGHGAVSTTINGGTISCPDYRSIRTNTGALIINGGNFVGQVWLQPNQGNTTLEVNGGTFAPTNVDGSCIYMTNSGEGYTVTDVSITDGTFTTKIGCSDATALAGCITGGTFSASAMTYTNAALLAEGTEYVENADGTYTVETAAVAVARIGDTTYTSLQEALNVGGEIVLLTDIALTEGVTVPAGVTATLELNGKTVSLADASGATAALITNNGTLTINDNVGGGALSFCTTTPGGQSYASNTITNRGTLVINGGTIENTTTGGSACYALDCYAGSTTTINGGKLTANMTAVRIFNWSTTEAKLTVTGGEIIAEGRYGINLNMGNTPAVTLEITGGTITTNDETYNLAVYAYMTNNTAYSAENVKINISGGTFGGSVALNGKTASSMAEGNVSITGGTMDSVICYADPAYGFISGGTFESDVSEYCAEDYVCQQNSDGTYGIIEYIAPPTTIVTELEDASKDFAVNFTTTATDSQKSEYRHWRADYQVIFNQDVTLGDGISLYVRCPDIEGFGTWIEIPAVTLAANQELNIVKCMIEALEGGSYDSTYYDIYATFSNADLGIAVTDDFVKNHPGFQATIQMHAYDQTDATAYNTVGLSHIFSAPALPTATATEIDKDDLTFAMNFKADEITDEQLAYYGDWYADFEITVNKTATYNADGTGNGYLAGQYDEWSENWVYVPFDESVTLEANETLKIMAYAAELLGEPGLKYTYKEVYEAVKDFDCGIYFTPEFLAANPDLEVTLELKMYNPDDETESYVIGETYVFTVPALPTATVTELEKDELTFALNFLADTPTAEQLAYYGDWFADFELTSNKDIVFNANGTADGWLSGQYDFVGESWINVPPSDVTLSANTPLRIMSTAAELLGEEGLRFTYSQIIDLVQDFDCGVYLDPAFIAANPDLEITLELKMYHPTTETVNYVIGETYTYELAGNVAMNTSTNTLYTDVSDGLDEAEAGETVILLTDATDTTVWINEGSILDLNGYTLTAKYVSSYGHVVDNSEANTGALVVDASKLMLQSTNKQLPIKTDAGYQFVEIIGFNSKMASAEMYAFQPIFEAAAHELLKNGVAVTGVHIQVVVTWTSGDEDTDSRTFQYGDEFVTEFVNSYNASTGKYKKMFTLTLVDAESYENLTCTAKVVSDTKVEFTA